MLRVSAVRRPVRNFASFASHRQRRPTSIGIADSHAAMPRSLARLRYRPPPMPINFSRIDATRPHLEALLERRVAAYVVRQSNPRHVKLQVVVNPKAKPQATGRFVPAPLKPFTLRDVVDPEGKARHGEIIYVFRNTKTNQIIYSLQELLDVRNPLPHQVLKPLMGA